ncbi:glycolipid transfer protein domain-containing protein [Mycena olivaceomarginata]|nr:glycolipid transfer protein domain-containing protein [Mycena olivaceomarginata]
MIRSLTTTWFLPLVSTITCKPKSLEQASRLVARSAEVHTTHFPIAFTHGPYFETVKSFADVQITDAGVNTEEFLLASDGLVAMFDLLGAGVFGFVQSDIKSNMPCGVRERYNATQASSATLEDLVRCDHAQGSREGTKCLVRLIRGLAFTCLALQTTQSEPALALHVCFRRAYDVVLRHHHTFVVRSVVTLAIRAVPRRDHFYAQISQGGDGDKFETELRRWLVAYAGVFG